MSNGAKWPKYTKWKLFERLEYKTLKKKKNPCGKEKGCGRETIEC
jgi:hypothetical protein